MPRPSYLLEFAGSMASVATHALVRKTYALLASTLVVTAVAALFGTSMAFPYQPPFILMILAFGVLFAILFTGAKQGPLALPLVFDFTGFIGLSLGPLLAVTSSATRLQIPPRVSSMRPDRWSAHAEQNRLLLQPQEVLTGGVFDSRVLKVAHHQFG